MKALTVWQPHASMIAHGYKAIETRSWRTRYRGQLIIVAGKKPWAGDQKRILPYGQAVAICYLADVRPLISGDLDAACLSRDTDMSEYLLFAWILRDVKPLPPGLPVRGMPGLYGLKSGPVTQAAAEASRKIVTPYEADHPERKILIP